MNNADVDKLLDECETELAHIEGIISSLGWTNLAVPYLNKYSVIKSCWTIEVAFKTLIADYCSKRSKQQVKNFLHKRVRESSTNPSYKNIKKTLSDFDSKWEEEFEKQLKTLTNHRSIRSSLESLVAARNQFAHGGNPTITFSDVKLYFLESKHLITTLDNVIG